MKFARPLTTARLFSFCYEEKKVRVFNSFHISVYTLQNITRVHVRFACNENFHLSLTVFTSASGVVDERKRVQIVRETAEKVNCVVWSRHLLFYLSLHAIFPFFAHFSRACEPVARTCESARHTYCSFLRLLASTVFRAAVELDDSCVREKTLPIFVYVYELDCH